MDSDSSRLDALATALAAQPGFAGIGVESLEPMHTKGLIHDHIRVGGFRRDGKGVVLRVPRGSHWGLTPAEALAYEAACFRRAAPSGRVPALFAEISPSAALPWGALAVEEIAGRPPLLPRDLAAIAETLAAVHALPLPPPPERPPLAVHDDPVAGTLARIEVQAEALPDAGIAPEACAAIEAELDWARGFSADTAGAEQPVTLVLTDTHPGNFLVRTDGTAVFVDLEKALYGSPGFDLAHASLYTSTTWDLDCAAALAADDVAAFYRRYLAAVPAALAERLRPWLTPTRRLTWLRTTTFAAGLLARGGPDADPRLGRRERAHLAAWLTDCFDPATVSRIRAEWLGHAGIGLG